MTKKLSTSMKHIFRLAVDAGKWIASIGGWMLINAVVNKAFDPHPYIFLNLVLSPPTTAHRRFT